MHAARIPRFASSLDAVRRTLMRTAPPSRLRLKIRSFLTCVVSCLCYYHRATLHLNVGSEGGQREVQHGDELILMAGRTLLRLCSLVDVPRTDSDSGDFMLPPLCFIRYPLVSLRSVREWISSSALFSSASPVLGDFRVRLWGQHERITVERAPVVSFKHRTRGKAVY